MYSQSIDRPSVYQVCPMLTNLISLYERRTFLIIRVAYVKLGSSALRTRLHKAFVKEAQLALVQSYTAQHILSSMPRRRVAQRLVEGETKNAYRSLLDLRVSFRTCLPLTMFVSQTSIRSTRLNEKTTSSP
jgi:hypothetical protein